MALLLENATATDSTKTKKPREKTSKTTVSRKEKNEAAATTVPVSRLNILTLPREIRQRILKFVFNGEELTLRVPPSLGGRARTSRLLSILAASRQMYDEAKPILLSKVSFAFGPHDPMVRSYWSHYNIIAGIGRGNTICVRKRTKYVNYHVSMWRCIQHLELTRKQFEGLSYNRSQLKGESFYMELKDMTVAGAGGIW